MMSKSEIVLHFLLRQDVIITVPTAVVITRVIVMIFVSCCHDLF